MNISNNFPSIEQMTNQLINTEKHNKVNTSDDNQNVSFEEILGRQTLLQNNSLLKNNTSKDGVIFSKHANERLQSRNIELSDEQLERLNEGTKLADEKGIKESLVMVDDYAFIVNVKNNTVVTAVGDSEKNVFTNIDGAVIA